MSDVLRGLRYALRGRRRAPGFTLVAALTLALGIGATTASFGVVHAVILRPLPYPAADRVVMVWMDNRSQNDLARLMARLLYQVSPTDVATLAVATSVLAPATLLANWLPARRAARVDLLVAVRSD